MNKLLKKKILLRFNHSLKKTRRFKEMLSMKKTQVLSKKLNKSLMIYGSRIYSPKKKINQNVSFLPKRKKHNQDLGKQRK